MKYTVMKCDICGEEFFSEYYEGGYIDHTNFTRNLHFTVKNGEDDIVYEICYNGNEIRKHSSRKSRLNCFCKYCEKNNIKELKEKVISQVKEFDEKIKQLDEIHDKIVDIVKPLKESEREYIGLRYSAFDWYRNK